jgi:hypothetical protein
MSLTFDPSTDFLTIVDFQEPVHFYHRISDTAFAAPVYVANATSRNPELGTTGEGRTVQLRRVRFFSSEDLAINLMIFLIHKLQLAGYVPSRSDKIVDGDGVEWYIKYVEINQTHIGTYRCSVNNNDS